MLFVFYWNTISVAENWHRCNIGSPNPSMQMVKDSLACCSSWDCKESDVTEWLKNNKFKYMMYFFSPLAKSKGEKERYKHLNAEFQRIARRDKKAFLSNQCKEIGGNNRMGKTRDLFKKIRDTKGTFHAKMGSIKNRNGRDLTEAEDIKKRWKKYTDC